MKKLDRMKKINTLYVAEDSDRGLTKTWNTLAARMPIGPEAPGVR